MSVLRSLSTSYSASKFLPPADSSQQFFLLHYILLLFFLCLFLLRRLNVSLLQIFSFYFPVFFPSADHMFCSQNALTEKIQTALNPCSISIRMIKRPQKFTIFFSFSLTFTKITIIFLSNWPSLSRSRLSTFYFQTLVHFPSVWPFFLFHTTWIASKLKQTSSNFVILLSNYFLTQTGQPWLLSNIFHCAIRSPNKQINKRSLLQGCVSSNSHTWYL